MRYSIITVDFLLSKGFIIQDHWRKSIDGTKVIIHYDMIEPTLVRSDNIDTYDYDSIEMNNILNGPEWLEQTKQDQQ